MSIDPHVTIESKTQTLIEANRPRRKSISAAEHQLHTMERVLPTIPARVAELRARDFAICHSNTDDSGTLHRRHTTVNVIYSVANKLGLEHCVMYYAVRFFDMFYASAPTPAGDSRRRHFLTYACVSLSVAGKCFGGDNNCMGDVGTMKYFWNTICNTDTYPYPTFRDFFIQCEGELLGALHYDLQIPSPYDYLSECSNWFDAQNAARNCTTRPLQELVAARGTGFYIDAMMMHPNSRDFSALEIAGVASYLATHNIRSVPQTNVVDTNMMHAMWSQVTWSASNIASKAILDCIDYSFGNYPTGILAEMYPIERDKWMEMNRDLLLNSPPAAIRESP